MKKHTILPLFFAMALGLGFNQAQPASKTKKLNKQLNQKALSLVQEQLEVEFLYQTDGKTSFESVRKIIENKITDIVLRGKTGIDVSGMSKEGQENQFFQRALRFHALRFWQTKLLIFGAPVMTNMGPEDREISQAANRRLQRIQRYEMFDMLFS